MKAVPLQGQALEGLHPSDERHHVERLNQSPTAHEIKRLQKIYHLVFTCVCVVLCFIDTAEAECHVPILRHNAGKWTNVSIQRHGRLEYKFFLCSSLTMFQLSCTVLSQVDVLQVTL